MEFVPFSSWNIMKMSKKVKEKCINLVPKGERKMHKLMFDIVLKTFISLYWRVLGEFRLLGFYLNACCFLQDGTKYPLRSLNSINNSKLALTKFFKFKKNWFAIIQMDYFVNTLEIRNQGGVWIVCYLKYYLGYSKLTFVNNGTSK